jgi:hypothetical protein
VLVDQVQRRHDYVRTSGTPGGGPLEWGSGGYNAAQAVGIRTSVSVSEEEAPRPEEPAIIYNNGNKNKYAPCSQGVPAGGISAFCMVPVLLNGALGFWVHLTAKKCGPGSRWLSGCCVLANLGGSP